MSKESAEEKLLRLIKSGQDKKHKVKKEGREPQRPIKELTSPSSAKRISALANIRRRIQTSGLESINKILVGSIVFILIFFILDVIYSRREFRQIYKDEADKEVKTASLSLPASLEGDFTDYSANLAGRDIFRASSVGSLSPSLGVSLFDPTQYASNLR